MQHRNRGLHTGKTNPLLAHIGIAERPGFDRVLLKIVLPWLRILVTATTASMSSSAKPQSLINAMGAWPSSWAGVPEDETIGKALVAEMRPFAEHLERSLASKAVRGHLDNLWLIGGEIIRQVNYDPRQRRLTAKALLLAAIELGEAPLARGVTRKEQESLDATAKRLLRFMTAHGTQ